MQSSQIRTKPVLLITLSSKILKHLNLGDVPRFAPLEHGEGYVSWVVSFQPKMQVYAIKQHAMDISITSVSISARLPFIAVHLMHQLQRKIPHEHRATEQTPRHSYLAIQITSDSSLQSARYFPNYMRQVLQVISSRDTKFSHEILCCAL
jgi:hypothetical protein